MKERWHILINRSTSPASQLILRKIRDVRDMALVIDEAYNVLKRMRSLKRLGCGSAKIDKGLAY